MNRTPLTCLVLVLVGLVGLAVGCEPLTLEPTVCSGEAVELDADPRHCGACGVRCSGVRGIAEGACVGGRCVVVACAVDGDTERLDVDGEPANGCEVARTRCRDGLGGHGLVDLERDPTHCGACGFDCGRDPVWARFATATRCERGVCVAIGCRGREPTAQRVTVDGAPFDQAICEPPPPSCDEPETCNGIDDDCDLRIDECPALPGTLPRVCGADRRCPATACAMGFVALDGDAGDADGCECERRGEERCDGVDDDCDGAVDEALGMRICGVGACARSAPRCVDGAIAPCAPAEPGDESCNGIDDDCDGTVDEDFDVGAACEVAMGACRRAGLRVCGAASDRTSCDAVPGLPTAEVCDGLDEDCDGAVDEDFDVGASCAVGVGVCRRQGVHVCDGPGAAVCDAQAGAPREETCDGLDDDCDGIADEALPAQRCGVGACAREVELCVEGALVPCEPGPPSDERSVGSPRVDWSGLDPRPIRGRRVRVDHGIHRRRGRLGSHTCRATNRGNDRYGHQGK